MNALALDIFSQKNYQKIDCNKYQNYNLNSYFNDISQYGIERTWDNICKYALNNDLNNNSLINPNNFGELYEKGLAYSDKNLKKASGQYFTPPDIALVMSERLTKCKGDNICDVGCGTGNLILEYLKSIKHNEAIKIINEGRLYLYDLDPVALKICLTSIAIFYGKENIYKINVFCGDFLDSNCHLPQNARVISNPPYSKINKIGFNWNLTEITKSTNELYAVFFEKIINESKSAVLITPFSFLYGEKFYPLRLLMCKSGNGFIVSFDNVPGNIFAGLKKGIFNTNHVNSVRPAITVYNQDDKQKGFKISYLIRFKQAERQNIVTNKFLLSTLSDYEQVINEKNKYFKKIDYRLTILYESWISNSNSKLSNLLKERGKYKIYFSNTCRYYTVASSKELNRNGFHIIETDDLDKFNYLYCFLNSSFAYWHWRIYDGAITYTKKNLYSLPVFFDKLNLEQKKQLNSMAKEIIDSESVYKVYKNNVGSQESIKFPSSIRNKLNAFFINLLSDYFDYSMFDIIHSNSALLDNNGD